MKNAIIAAVVALLVSSTSGFAVSESMQSRTLEKRVTKLEKRMTENTRRDNIVQNVLYMKSGGLYPQFLSMKMKFDECFDGTKRLEDGTLVLTVNPFCAGVFGPQQQ